MSWAVLGWDVIGLVAGLRVSLCSAVCDDCEKWVLCESSSK
jgi:hypothetical protein